jgi:hypothetical protein
MVKDLFSRYTLVRLYGDYLPAGYPPKPSAEENRAFQATFLNNQRPFYVILEPLPDGSFKMLGSYKEGMIQKIPAFVEFLKEPLTRSMAKTATQQVVSQK